MIFLSALEVAAMARKQRLQTYQKQFLRQRDYHDTEYWKSAIMDEIMNHEEVLHVFGPPIPRTNSMKVTPTCFLFSKKIISLEEQNQDSKSSAYIPIPKSADYECFRAQLLYVNNKFTREQSLWEELFDPGVDKTLVRIFLATCAMHHKHLQHLDVVSSYLQAKLTGSPRYIALWGD